jgi:hypothetical protein
VHCGIKKWHHLLLETTTKKKKKHPEVTLNFMFSEISSLLEAGTRCNAEDHD